MWTSVKAKSKKYFSFTDFFAHVHSTPPLRSHYWRWHCFTNSSTPLKFKSQSFWNWSRTWQNPTRTRSFQYGILLLSRNVWKIWKYEATGEIFLLMLKEPGLWKFKSWLEKLKFIRPRKYFSWTNSNFTEPFLIYQKKKTKKKPRSENENQTSKTPTSLYVSLCIPYYVGMIYYDFIPP